MNPLHDRAAFVSRRHFFGCTATGIGTAALASLLAALRPQSQTDRIPVAIPNGSIPA